MDVYALYPDCKDEYRPVTMCSGNLDEFLWRFDGTPMKGRWTDVTVLWNPEMSRLPKGDYPFLMLGLPIFTRRAIEVLGDLLEGNGEIIPTTCEGDQIFFFNVTKVIDALDESDSEVIRFDDSSDVMRIGRHVFFRIKLVGSLIFKIPQWPTRRVYVTDRFVKRVESTGLKGFWFRRVWSTDKAATIDNVC